MAPSILSGALTPLVVALTNAIMFSDPDILATLADNREQLGYLTAISVWQAQRSPGSRQ
jgi:hypothetical protein